MARLIRSLDWSGTGLGPIHLWPAPLRITVDVMLAAQAQIVLFWGPDFIALYNDAYAPSIGAKHPGALGRPAREHWSELWSDLEPLLRRVLKKGETVVAKSRPFYIERHDFPETVYFDISYSPVRGDDQEVAGVLCIVNETTERVISEKALRRSEEKLRAIFSQTAAGIAQMELDGRFVFVNSRFSEIAGFAEPDLLAMTMTDLLHPRDRDRCEALLAGLRRDGTSFEVDMRLLRKDGSAVWVTTSLSPLRDGKGEIRQAVAVAVDITDRKRAQDGERRLAAIIASSTDAILGMDLDMNITSWNQGAERLYGYSAEEAIGRPVTLILPAGGLDNERSMIARVRRGERVEPHEAQRRHKDGRMVDVSLSVSPIVDEHGEIVGISKIARDISARKEADRLQSLLLGELNHRVKNVLATVAAIARQTFGRDDGSVTASEAFHARLASLSRAHDTLIHGNWEKADLHAIIEAALSPYPPERFRIDGPALQLPPKAVVAMALALHELATNALKYGALSAPGGKVSIRWAVEHHSPARLKFRWTEEGGPPAGPPSRRGFGSRLIEGLLSRELQGEARIAYLPSGVVCEVDAPLDPVGETFPSAARSELTGAAQEEAAG